VSWLSAHSPVQIVKGADGSVQAISEYACPCLRCLVLCEESWASEALLRKGVTCGRVSVCSGKQTGKDK
jgi:hypothetical protein